jgi:poly(3-hydroxybutyrate) depolymerase
MIYQMYQAQADAMAPIRAMADVGRAMLQGGLGGLTPFWSSRLGAAYELISRAGFTHTRPAFGIDAVEVGGETVAVREEATLVTPFGTLLHFKKATDAVHPRVLIVAPMSGHFATLLRGTVRTMLPENDVYVTDWHNARDVPLADGAFGIDDYVEHIVRFLEALGPGAHVVAVCQPCVPVLAAVAVMSEAQNPAVPRSMTLMAGPIDARLSPTKVNELATGQSIEWFERNLIATVPYRYAGAQRRVYPGFLQLMAFMSMNLDRHLKAHRDLFDHLVAGDTAKAQAVEAFYDEYFAVLDLTAEFYLETVRSIFQEYDLARGVLQFRGQRVNPAAIGRTALLTVEGERDDVCGIGQTMAAHDLCTGLRPYLKRHHLQVGVGHYGVFSGTRWSRQIYPMVRNVILATDETMP